MTRYKKASSSIKKILMKNYVDFKDNDIKIMEINGESNCLITPRDRHGNFTNNLKSRLINTPKMK